MVCGSYIEVIELERKYKPQAPPYTPPPQKKPQAFLPKVNIQNILQDYGLKVSNEYLENNCHSWGYLWKDIVFSICENTCTATG